tara:strand:- start:629 stop:1672 length:1044 start_codon:yes stop_codon:yes gene_type:complete
MNVETSGISAQYINQSFIRKLEDGRVKEAQDEGSRFIRSKLRQESFAREILEPVEIGADEIDRDEHTDQPKKIIEKEPDSVATFVTFKGSGQRTFFRGPRYSVSFGKIETEHFTKSKFELLTYQNDIRKILTDNSVKDMADVEDKKFIETVAASMNQVGGTTILGAGAAGGEVRDGGEAFLANQLGANKTQFATQNVARANILDVNDTKPLSKELITQLFQSMTMSRMPIGKLLMSKSTFMEVLKFDNSDVGNDIVSAHYRDGIAGEEKLFGVPVITTIKNDIIADNEIYLFAPENYLGNFFLLQDATLFIKQEADMIEFWSYSAPGIGIGNANGIKLLKNFLPVNS